MKIAVYGTGGVGGYFGSRLAAAGEDVTFIARGTHLEAMRKNGLVLKSGLGDLHIDPARATDDPASIGPVDAVFISVKLYDTESAAEGCKPLVGPDTLVVSFQNGVTAADTLSAALGSAPVIGGTTYIMSTIKSPGVISHLGTMAKLVFGELDGKRTARVEALLAACENAGFDATLNDNITSAIWHKFVFFAALSGLTALMRKPIGPIRTDPDTRALCRATLEEGIAVAAAKGIAMPPNMIDKHMTTVDGLPETMASSMYHDISAGKRLELPWISGAMVRFGRELDVPTPIHEMICTALKLHVEGEK
jgi:2-dehydropantoate 2-reductase